MIVWGEAGEHVPRSGIKVDVFGRACCGQIVESEQCANLWVRLEIELLEEETVAAADDQLLW